MREVMRQRLDGGEACFRFQVQLQTHGGAMPIEDSVVRWDEDESPYRDVATLRIPSQAFDTEAQDRFCEDLAITPWHSLPEHRPLGNVNRARLSVYQAASKLRQELNGAQRFEPTGHDIEADRR